MISHYNLNLLLDIYFLPRNILVTIIEIADDNHGASSLASTPTQAKLCCCHTPQHRLLALTNCFSMFDQIIIQFEPHDGYLMPF